MNHRSLKPIHSIPTQKFIVPFFDAAFRCDTQNNLVEHDYQMIFDFDKNLLKAKLVLLVVPLSILLDMYCYGSVYLIANLLL